MRIPFRRLKWMSRYGVDGFVMVILTALNMPLLLSTPYPFHFDVTVYLSIALNVAHRHGLIGPSGYPVLGSHPPLYPLILGFLIPLANGDALHTIWLVKIIFAVPTTWAIYALGKHLSNRWVGVIAALLVTYSALFREGFNYTFIDTIGTFFLFVALLFMWLNYESNKRPWLIISGLSMGMAFLQKETFLFAAPIPWLLFFLDWRYQLNVKLRDLWIYTALVMLPFFVWLFWSYHWIGRMIPMNIKITELVIKWGEWILIIAIAISFLFNLIQVKGYAVWYKSIWYRRWLLMGGIAGAISLAPLLSFFQTDSTQVSRSLPWVTIPPFITEQPQFFPFFGLMAVACLFIVLRAIKVGDPSSTFSTVFLIMGFLFLNGVAGTGVQHPRQIMGVVFIIYLLFIRVFFLAIIRKSHFQYNRFRQIIYFVTIISAATLVVLFIKNQNTQLQQLDIKDRNGEESVQTGWYNYRTISPAVAWIKDNIRPGTPILASFLFTYPIYYMTNGLYPIYEFPMCGLQFNPSSPLHLLVRGAHYFRSADPALARIEPEQLPKDTLFVDTYSRQGYQHFTEDQDLFVFLQDNKIEYLILTDDYLQQAYLYLDYFTSNPGFKLVWHGKYETYMALYIFRVNRAMLHPQGQYKTVITPAALKSILNGSSGSYNVGDVANFFPRGLSLRPLTRNDNKLATDLAQHYLRTSQFSPSYDLYRSINDVNPNDIGQKLARQDQEPFDKLEKCMIYLVINQLAQAKSVCNQVTTLFPESSIPHMILGEVALAQDQLDEAIPHFQTASKIHADSTTYIRLGDVYRMNGQINNAYKTYKQAAQVDPTNQIAKMHIAESLALLADAQGKWNAALHMYREAINLYPSYWSNANSTDQANVDHQFSYINDNFLDINPSIQQNILIINRRPMRVLLSSGAKFGVTILEEERLSFSIGLSPDVWQVGKGDGVQFGVSIDEGSTNQNIFSTYIDPKNNYSDRRWYDYDIDLSSWAGKTVTITFAMGCGPNNDCRYDWAGWGEPNINQRVSYNFLQNFNDAQVISTDSENTYIETQTINNVQRAIIFQHPTSRLVFTLNLPHRSNLAFGFGMAPEVWSSDKGDGVEYNIYVRRLVEPDKLYLVFRKYIDPKNNAEDRRWFDERLDLSQFSGQAVEFLFETRPGPADNANFDWGGWSTPVLIDMGNGR